MPRCQFLDLRSLAGVLQLEARIGRVTATHCCTAPQNRTCTLSMHPLGLHLSQARSRVCRHLDEGFGFLGFHFQRGAARGEPATLSRVLLRFGIPGECVVVRVADDVGGWPPDVGGTSLPPPCEGPCG